MYGSEDDNLTTGSLEAQNFQAFIKKIESSPESRFNQLVWPPNKLNRYQTDIAKGPDYHQRPNTVLGKNLSLFYAKTVAGQTMSSKFFPILRDAMEWGIGGCKFSRSNPSGFLTKYSNKLAEMDPSLDPRNIEINMNIFSTGNTYYDQAITYSALGGFEKGIALKPNTRYGIKATYGVVEPLDFIFSDIPKPVMSLARDGSPFNTGLVDLYSMVFAEIYSGQSEYLPYLDPEPDSEHSYYKDDIRELFQKIAPRYRRPSPRLCEYLEKKMKAFIRSNMDVAHCTSEQVPDQPVAEIAQNSATQLEKITAPMMSPFRKCIGCHVGKDRVGPEFHFEDPKKLKAQLKENPNMINQVIKAITDGSMPKFGSKLSPEEIQAIENELRNP